MSADGHQVDVVFGDVDGDLPDRLGAVGMEEHASGSTHGACRQHPSISMSLHTPSVLHPDFSPALHTVLVPSAKIHTNVSTEPCFTQTLVVIVTYFSDWLLDSNLVVDGHDGDEGSVWTDGRLQELYTQDGGYRLAVHG